MNKQYNFCITTYSNSWCTFWWYVLKLWPLDAIHILHICSDLQILYRSCFLIGPSKLPTPLSPQCSFWTIIDTMVFHHIRELISLSYFPFTPVLPSTEYKPVTNLLSLWYEKSQNSLRANNKHVSCLVFPLRTCVGTWWYFQTSVIIAETC